jgi:flotillin
VWDTGNGKDGKTSTANFMQGLFGSIPPLEDVFKSAGMELPNYLKGEVKDETLVENLKIKKEDPKDLK